MSVIRGSDLARWGGYEFARPASARWPVVYPGAELDLRRLLWARLLSQLEKRSSCPGLSYALDRSALWDARSCGMGSGLVRECTEGGHSYFTPLGCGARWCLRCAGLAADLRAMRVHRDLRELADLADSLTTGSPPVVVRIQLTLALEHRDRVIAEDRDGVNALIRAGRRAIAAAAGSDGTMPVMLTVHPTSSKRPWLRSPHLHAVALWSDLDENGARPLPWSEPGRPISVDALREAWGAEYDGSKAVRVAYYRRDDSGAYTRPTRGAPQALASALRYDLRPFTEDVFAAVADRRLGIPGGNMRDLLNPWRPPTLRGDGETPDDDIPALLEADGGVLLWPRFHRVRRYGALASRGYAARAEALHRLAGTERGERSPLCDCPECGSLLAVVMDEDEDDGRRWPRLEMRSVAESEGRELLAGSGLARPPSGVLEC